MKKILFVLAAAVLAFVSCDSNGSVDEGQIVGSWEPVKVIDNIEQEGTEYDPEDYGTPMLWIFSENGDFEWRKDDEPQPGKWTLEGTELTLTMRWMLPEGSWGDYEAMPPMTVKSLTSSKMILEWEYFDEGEDAITIHFKKL